MSWDRSGSNRWASSDRDFNRQNRFDHPNRQNWDSGRGCTSQNDRFNSYKRPHEDSDYGQNSRNKRYSQGDRDYEDSYARSFESNKYNSERRDHLESSRDYFNKDDHRSYSNERSSQRGYSIETVRHTTRNDSYNPRNEERNYSRSPTHQTGNYYSDSIRRKTQNDSYNQRDETRNDFYDPRDKKTNDFVNSKDERRNYSRSPTHQRGNFCSDPIKHETLNDFYTPRDERRHYSRSPTHQRGNFCSDSIKHETLNDSYNPRDERRNYSRSPTHQTGNYSSDSRRHLTQNDFYNSREEHENHPISPRREVLLSDVNFNESRRQSRSGSYNSRNEVNNYESNRPNVIFDSNYFNGSRRIDSYNSIEETRNYSRSPGRETVNSFNEPRCEVQNNPRNETDETTNNSISPRCEIGNNFNELRRKKRKYPDIQRNETRNLQKKNCPKPRTDQGNNQQQHTNHLVEPMDTENTSINTLCGDNRSLDDQKSKFETTLKEEFDSLPIAEIPLTTFDEESDDEGNVDDENVEVISGPAEIKHMDCHNLIMENNTLDQNSKIILIFLSHAFFNIPHKNGHRMHCDIMSKCYLGHRNALKLYRYEVWQSLEEKYRQDGVKPEDVHNRKRNNLRLARDSSLVEIDFVFKEATEEEKALRVKMIDDCIDLLSADSYPKEFVPEDKDYVWNPENILTEDEMKQDFQSEFVQLTYKELGFKLVDIAASVKDLLSFHLDVIPALVMESVRDYCTRSAKVKPGDQISLPAMLKNFLRHDPLSNILRCQHSRVIFEKQASKGDVFETEVMDILPPGADLCSQTILNFTNSILYFDQILTVVRFRLLTYKPFILLSPYVKLQLFNEIVNNIYSNVLELWKNGTKLSEKKFNIKTPAKKKKYEDSE